MHLDQNNKMTCFHGESDWGHPSAGVGSACTWQAGPSHAVVHSYLSSCKIIDEFLNEAGFGSRAQL